MEHNFWHERWQNNQIGFHLAEANPLLVKYFSSLNLQQGARVFIPLCGKTVDIAWLLTQGYCVAGAELSQIATEDLFNNLHLTPTITTHGEITHYSAPNIDVFVGDIFKVTPAMLGKVDAVYDRAALVALPNEMRGNYTTHIGAITQHAPQLLICFVYDQSLQAGPPFSVSAEEAKLHYHNFYDLMLLATKQVDGGLKGVCPATEQVWLLKPLRH